MRRFPLRCCRGPSRAAMEPSQTLACGIDTRLGRTQVADDERALVGLKRETLVPDTWHGLAQALPSSA